MTHQYTSKTYIDASAQLDRACAWLADIGINYSPTRVGKYKKIFTSMAKHQQAERLQALLEEELFENWVNAVHEVAEITRIFEGLNTQDNNNLIQRLKKSLKGHDKYVLEDNDSSGRDFSFELAVAAKFARCGYSIDFGHDADVAVDIEQFKFYVECKRLKSEPQVEKRISEGLKQLTMRYESSPTPSQARGILVLSTGKMLNSKLGLLVADNSKTLADAAFSHNEGFIDRYKSCWQADVDQRTLGVAVILDAPGVIESEKKLVTCHEITINNSIPVETDNYALLLRVAHKVFG